MRQAVLVSALCIFSAGCGLFDDVTTITVDTDWQQFTLDADVLDFDTTEVAVPEIDCSTATDICAASSSIFICDDPRFTCGLRCGDKGSCEVVATAEENLEVDISKQIDGQGAQALKKVAFDRLVYNTDDNTLNFATPRITFYVGPGSAELTTDQGVVRFAELDPIEPGKTPNLELPVDPAGEQALAGFVQEYQKPFKFLAKAELSFGAGQQLPKGKLMMKVKAYFKIDL